jgi:PEP-CTERM motif
MSRKPRVTRYGPLLSDSRISLMVIGLMAAAVSQVRADVISDSAWNNSHNSHSGSAPKHYTHGNGSNGLVNGECNTGGSNGQTVPSGCSPCCTPPTPSVPEPASMVLAVLGAFGMTGMVWRNARRRAAPAPAL